MHYLKYAVLGSNSFAGSVFIGECLRRGLSVIGFNRSPEGSKIFLSHYKYRDLGKYIFVQADLNFELEKIKKNLDEFEPEVVVDFSGQGMVAQSWEYPHQWYQTNIVSKVKLHDYLRQVKWLKRYIRVSTPEVYGSNEVLIKESWNYNPSTPYAVSHAAIDMSLKAFNQQYDFPVIFTRFANFYGPGQQLYRIIPRAIICASFNLKLQLHGGGKSIRAFINAADVAEAIFKSACFGVVGEIYHFSPNEFMTIRQVVETIAVRMNVKDEDLFETAPERPGKDMAYLMNSAKARQHLGWDCQKKFDVGLDDTIEWIQSSLGEIKSLKWDYQHKA
jgi:dTDP-glucose 4,6-dehydratase